MADERARRASWRRRLPPTPAASPTWCLLKCAYRVTRAHHTGAVCHSAREAAATAASTRSQRADEGGAGRHSHLGRAALPPGCPAPAPEARTPPRIEWGGTTFFWGDSLQITARRTNPPAPLAPRRSLLLRFRLARPHRHPSCVRQHPLHASYGPWQRPVSAGGCGRSASDSDRALARWRSQARQARATATRLRWWWMLGATACPPRAPSRSSANSRRCRRSRIGGCSGARGCQPRPACLLHRCLPTNERPPLAGLPPRQTWFARCWASWARWAAVRASPAWRRAPLAAALLLLLVLPALAPQRTPAPTITLPCPPPHTPRRALPALHVVLCRPGGRFLCPRPPLRHRPLCAVHPVHCAGRPGQRSTGGRVPAVCRCVWRGGAGHAACAGCTRVRV